MSARAPSLAPAPALAHSRGVAHARRRRRRRGASAAAGRVRELTPAARTRSRDHAPIRIPLVINIFLVNLDYNANNVFMALHASDLEQYLMNTFPSLQPSCLETGEQLHVKYDLWYHVAHIDSEHKNMIEHAVRAAMLPTTEDTTEHARSQARPEKLKDGGSGAGSGVHFRVPIAGRVANSFKQVHDIYAPASARRYRFDEASSEDKKPQEGGFFKRGGGSSASSDEPTVQTYSLFVANLDKTLVAPEHVVEQVEKDPEAAKSATKRRQSIVKAFTYAYYMDTEAGRRALQRARPPPATLTQRRRIPPPPDTPALRRPCAARQPLTAARTSRQGQPRTRGYPTTALPWWI